MNTHPNQKFVLVCTSCSKKENSVSQTGTGECFGCKNKRETAGFWWLLLAITLFGVMLMGSFIALIKNSY